jgi:hypothetical protein
MNRIVGDHFLSLTAETEEMAPAIYEVPGEQKKTTVDLYFVECRTQLIETVEDNPRPVPSRGFGAREVTFIYMSFAHCDISIAVPGSGVTLEGGANGT